MKGPGDYTFNLYKQSAINISDNSRSKSARQSAIISEKRERIEEGTKGLALCYLGVQCVGVMS